MLKFLKDKTNLIMLVLVIMTIMLAITIIILAHGDNNTLHLKISDDSIPPKTITIDLNTKNGHLAVTDESSCSAVDCDNETSIINKSTTLSNAELEKSLQAYKAAKTSGQDDLMLWAEAMSKLADGNTTLLYSIINP